ncbi:MAG: RNA polymerase sigma factor [Candidatus Hydrogenedentes bacterium]|nr:RNA polymerase sigma factor [Candidatus Hydrogenedentota bacterium]
MTYDDLMKGLPPVAADASRPRGEEQPIDADRTLEDLIAREFPRLQRLAWRFGLPADELDDAVQEVFAKAWAGRGRFRGDAALTTWLTRVAVNHFTSRRQGWLRRMRVFHRDPDQVDRAPASGGNIETNDGYERAVACIRQLPPKLRQVLVLRYLEEMSCAEVAETLGIPEATVRTRVFHARKKLRDRMGEHE